MKSLIKLYKKLINNLKLKIKKQTNKRKKMKISNRPNKRQRKNNILNRENVPDTFQIVFLSFYIFQFIEDILTGSVILSVKLGERSGTENIKINEYKV